VAPLEPLINLNAFLKATAEALSRKDSSLLTYQQNNPLRLCGKKTTTRGIYNNRKDAEPQRFIVLNLSTESSSAPLRLCG
jgi:hypothetical protein